MAYGAADRLADNGIMTPSDNDWRITLTFDGGVTRKIRVSPSTVSESDAVDRAMVHAGVTDKNEVVSVTAERVKKTVQVAPYGMIHK